MKNSILSLIMVVAIVILASCSKDDPTPTQPQKTALDSVKTAMTGTWMFQSVNVIQPSSGKNATTSSCAQTELNNAKFTDANWKVLVPEFKFAYAGNTSAVGTNVCGTASANYTITAVQNTDGSVNIKFDAGGSSAQVYQVKSKNISSTLVTATLVSNGSAVASSNGYTITYKFAR